MGLSGLRVEAWGSGAGPNPSPKPQAPSPYMLSACMRILVIDVGGTHVKLMHTGSTEVRKFDSGNGFTPEQVIAGVRLHTADWTYDVVTIGIPSPVIRGRVYAEPWNLGTGWVAFDWAAGLVGALQAATNAGMRLVFGYLAGGATPFDVIRPETSFILAFQALPLILVISALSRLLYHWGILQAVVRVMARAMMYLMHTSGAETLSAAAMKLSLPYFTNTRSTGRVAAQSNAWPVESWKAMAYCEPPPTIFSIILGVLTV